MKREEFERSRGTPPMTLAQQLGQTAHICPLLRRTDSLAGKENPACCLKELAVRRGCRHYCEAFNPPSALPAGFEKLTNEEAGIALCLGQLPYEPTHIRVAAELLSSNTCRPERLARLARQERCQTVVAYIANSGRRVEPENPAWEEIFVSLGPTGKPPPGVLPHWTGFASLTGITQGGKGPHTQWLRPQPAHEQSA
jgi:hypothetical protein